MYMYFVEQNTSQVSGAACLFIKYLSRCTKLNAALHAYVTTKGLLLGLKLIHIHLAFVQQLPVEHSP